jgi:RNA polymerase sigma-70 factor (ECF subfamily)
MATFIAAVRGRGQPSPELVSTEADAATILKRLAEARATWPGIELDDDVFVRYWAARITVTGSLGDALTGSHAGDLFLACASVERCRGAVELLEASFVRPLEGWLARQKINEHICGETLQRLRHRLVAEEPPKLGDYNGQGPLKGWLRVVALREALYLSKQARKHVPWQDDALLEGVGGEQGDPELSYLREVYQAEFKHSFAAGVRALSIEERNVLRQHYVFGMSIDQLGVFLSVHRSTAARQLNRAEAKLLDAVRGDLLARLRVTSSEFHSLVRLVQSELRVSLRLLLSNNDP